MNAAAVVATAEILKVESFQVGEVTHATSVEASRIPQRCEVKVKAFEHDLHRQICIAKISWY